MARLVSLSGSCEHTGEEQSFPAGPSAQERGRTYNVIKVLLLLMCIRLESQVSGTEGLKPFSKQGQKYDYTILNASIQFGLILLQQVLSQTTE